MTSAATARDVFGPARRVLFVHAHPDDESISTGATIAELAASGVECFVLTATRGERDARSGRARYQPAVTWSPCASPSGCEPADARRQPLPALGTWPARPWTPLRASTPTRDGLVDAAETLAGPALDASADALYRRRSDEIAADIAACARALAADALVTYDALGGYGHPDHVALHAPTRAAASTLGLPFSRSSPKPAAKPRTTRTPPGSTSPTASPDLGGPGLLTLPAHRRRGRPHPSAVSASRSPPDRCPPRRPDPT